MTIAAFLHGYPPGWSMGGELSTHRTLRSVPGSFVFTNTDKPYILDGVSVRPFEEVQYDEMALKVGEVEADILFGHSSLSYPTIRVAKRLGLPSILAIHAPQRFGADLRRAWSSATVRLYNTEAARRDWRDPTGVILHPPIGEPDPMPHGPGDAFTLTSSLLNKGADKALQLAKLLPEQRFIFVTSPAHHTHGSPTFKEDAALLPNVEVWPRVHPNKMGTLWAETRILLVPSRYETYGMAALEAAHHGIPSVHVDTVHVREGIGDAARLLRSRNVGELKRAVEEVERDYDQWSDKAYTRAQVVLDRERKELARFATSVGGLTGP